MFVSYDHSQSEKLIDNEFYPVVVRVMLGASGSLFRGMTLFRPVSGRKGETAVSGF